MAAIDAFVPPLQRWFSAEFSSATDIQEQSWPLIRAGQSVLLAAPTGSGKTLAAFLAVLDREVFRILRGEPPSGLRTIYVTPLRALSADIAQNLEAPLAAVEAALLAAGHRGERLRATVRTGDTKPHERAKFLKDPSTLLVTTPESLYVLLGSARGRVALASVETIIVDEIHALVDEVRGAHLTLTLERLQRLVKHPLQRIGLSATLAPPDLLAAWLQGSGSPVTVVDARRSRVFDFAIETPTTELLSSVASDKQIDQILDRLAVLVLEHRSTLIFTNTRRLAERLAFRLGERLGRDQVSAHHGSLAPKRRHEVEQRLKAGTQKAVVATGSLELGIDVGAVDLVVQIGSPRRLSSLVQRAGRACHQVGGIPKARLFPLTRDDLLECAAAVKAGQEMKLEHAHPPRAPLDVLAQQLVAELVHASMARPDLRRFVHGAAPYRDLSDSTLDALLIDLQVGLETSAGRRGAWLIHDAERDEFRARTTALLPALLHGGTIPDHGDFRVILEGEDIPVGSVGEDFAVECAVGDVFLIGTRAWRVRAVRAGDLLVVAAGESAPTVPFWVGDAPGRSAELSAAVCDLRQQLGAIRADGPELETLRRETGLDASGMQLLRHYLDAGCAELQACPDKNLWIAERFFDGAGGQQLVLHVPLGNRINRALGLLLRKRLCRSFDQELQAAATDDAVLVSLTETQAFPLDSLPGLLKSEGAAAAVEQALLLAPMFKTRFRWCAARALFFGRGMRGKRLPFPVQRFQAEDLLASAFPASTACQEHQTYPIELPAHFIVQAALQECREEATDVPGLVAALRGMEAGKTRWHWREMSTPSVFAHEILHARPSAYLDDAPLEERRTRTVSTERKLPPAMDGSIRLTLDVIEQVESEARMGRTHAQSAERLHDLGLVRRGAPEWEALLQSQDAALVDLCDGVSRVAARTRLRAVREWEAASLDGSFTPDLLKDALRGHLAWSRPRALSDLGLDLGQGPEIIRAAAASLQASGVAFLGWFDPSIEEEQVVERSVLQRLVAKGRALKRAATAAVPAWVYMTWLARAHGLAAVNSETSDPLAGARVGGLLGWKAPLSAWHEGLWAVREPFQSLRKLEAACGRGEFSWRGGNEARICARTQVYVSAGGAPFEAQGNEEAPTSELPHEAQAILLSLQEEGGASEPILARRVRLLPSRVTDALRELAGRGLIRSSSWLALLRVAGLARSQPRGVGTDAAPIWEVVPPPLLIDADEQVAADVELALDRYGVLSADLLRREPSLFRIGDALRCLRRFELRGRVQSGWFVEGLRGEQWARPATVASLAKAPREGLLEAFFVHLADPLALHDLLFRTGDAPDPESSGSDSAAKANWVELRSDGSARRVATPRTRIVPPALAQKAPPS